MAAFIIPFSCPKVIGHWALQNFSESQILLRALDDGSTGTGDGSCSFTNPIICLILSISNTNCDILYK
jgi:hypothetical protein